MKLHHVRKLPFLALFGGMVITLPCLAGEKLNKGIELYNARNYQSALQVLIDAAASESANDARAHYYLANTYLQLGQMHSALKEYRASYALDKTGPSAQLCLQAINDLTAKLEADGATKSGAHQSASPTDATTGGGSGVSASNSANLSAAEQRIAQSLPPFPKTNNLGPSHKEIMQWSNQQRGDYVPQAQVRITQAEENVAAAQNVFKRAQSVVHSIVPSTRAFGESESDFKARVESARRKEEDLLRPYQAFLEQHQKALADSKALYQECVYAKQSYDGWSPVGGEASR